MREKAGDPPTLAITGWLLKEGEKAPLDAAGFPNWTPADGARWLDVVPTGEPLTAREIHTWSETLGLAPMAAAMAGDLDHHPRLARHGTGILLSLREAPLGSDRTNPTPTAFNLWCDGEQLVTVHGQPVVMLAALAEAVAEGRGPVGAGAGLVWLVEHLVKNLRLVVTDQERQMDTLEACIHNQDFHNANQQLSRLRGQLSRLLLLHAQPQVQALRALANLPLPWLDGGDNRHLLRESATRLSRLVRELTHLNERLEHQQEAFANWLDHRLNMRVYTLTMVTGVFFPMVFLTGLLGVNLGGIPGSDTPWAFTVFCLLLITLGAGCGWWFHRHKWL